ncbi:hypothetical protein K490DRAFT_57414 [Saccharata proteae CBS 121410]|uniref:Uncharacterized protein n=1 Tax=Saccharata proteae CBS 121410 TaxID=1314787 RepID=A0A9P4HU82_9PEZI|nr:hypothetical protein K490DRAFT_57414 [Saccharata proteae CBS 121410]
MADAVLPEGWCCLVLLGALGAAWCLVLRTWCLGGAGLPGGTGTIGWGSVPQLREPDKTRPAATPGCVNVQRAQWLVREDDRACSTVSKSAPVATLSENEVRYSGSHVQDEAAALLEQNSSTRGTTQISDPHAPLSGPARRLGGDVSSVTIGGRAVTGSSRMRSAGRAFSRRCAAGRAERRALKAPGSGARAHAWELAAAAMGEVEDGWRIGSRHPTDPGSMMAAAPRSPRLDRIAWRSCELEPLTAVYGPALSICLCISRPVVDQRAPTTGSGRSFRPPQGSQCVVQCAQCVEYVECVQCVQCVQCVDLKPHRPEPSDPRPRPRHSTLHTQLSLAPGIWHHTWQHP